MNTNKFLVGGIIGGIAYFLIGWGVWGVALNSFMMDHTTAGGKAAMRAEADMIWWALIVANLLWGFVLSFVCAKANVSSAGSGASIGAVLGLLVSAGMNCFNYAMMPMSDSTGMAVDIVASTVVGGIVGAIIGWYMGRGK